MTMRIVGSPLWSAAIVLVLSAAPCASAEGAAGKQRAAGELAKGQQTGRDAMISPVVGGSDADMQERYLAARKATEARERDWDRRMKQLTKDVCTGC